MAAARAGSNSAGRDRAREPSRAATPQAAAIAPSASANAPRPLPNSEAKSPVAPCMATSGELLGLARAPAKAPIPCGPTATRLIAAMSAPPARVPATARQSRLPAMKATIPRISWGLAIAAVKPMAKPARAGWPPRHAAYPMPRPRTQKPSHWASTRRAPVPKPAMASSPIRHLARPGRSRGQGAARTTTKTASARNVTWSSDHTRYAAAASRRLTGAASTAAAGGFSKGMYRWFAGAPEAARTRRSVASSYIRAPSPVRQSVAATYVPA